MVDTGIFATTAEVQRKVSAYASATANTEAYINQFMMEAESYINNVSEYNWSDAYPSLNDDVKQILKMTASAKAAMSVINYDIKNFPSIRAAELTLDVLSWEVDKGLAQLKESLKRGFITNAGTGSYVKRALLIPNMTTAERVALSASTGMVVYDSDLDALVAYMSDGWAQITDGGPL